MIVYMSWDPSASRASKVDTDVVAIWVHSAPDTADRATQLQHESSQFVRHEVMEVGRVGIRHHHQMPWIIGKLVEDDENVPTTPQDEVVTVRLRSRERAKDAFI
jgi:hypothetical protein